MAFQGHTQRSVELAPVLATVAVVKGNGQGPGPLGHHVEGVVPAGDRAFDHHQRPAQGGFEAFPAAFPDGDGDQSLLVFQREKHRFGQGTLPPPYHPAGHAHHVAVVAALHRVAVQYVRPQQRGPAP